MYFALVGLILGSGYLMESQLRDQNGINVIVALAERDPDWRSSVPGLDRESGCNASPLQPDETIVDASKGVFRLDWTCHFRTGWIADGWTISVSALGVREMP